MHNNVFLITATNQLPTNLRLNDHVTDPLGCESETLELPSQPDPSASVETSTNPSTPIHDQQPSIGTLGM